MFSTLAFSNLIDLPSLTEKKIFSVFLSPPPSFEVDFPHLYVGL